MPGRRMKEGREGDEEGGGGGRKKEDGEEGERGEEGEERRGKRKEGKWERRRRRREKDGMGGVEVKLLEAMGQILAHLALSTIYFEEGYSVLSVYFTTRWMRQVAFFLQQLKPNHMHTSLSCSLYVSPSIFCF